MFLESEINTIEDFEKYSFLLDLVPIKLRELEYLLNNFQDFEKEYFLFKQKFDNVLSNDNITKVNLKKLNNKEEINFIKDLVNKEIEKNKKYLNYLKYILNDNNVFLVDTFKDNLKKGKILKKEYIEKLKTNKNNNSINNVIKMIDEMEKSIFNKDLKTKKIIMLERKIIDEIEVILDKLCFIFNLEYENKDVKNKYFLITSLLKNKNKAYNTLNSILIKKICLLDDIDNLNLSINIKDIEKISEDGLNFLLEKLKLYEMHKKDNTIKVNFMFK